MIKFLKKFLPFLLKAGLCIALTACSTPMEKPPAIDAKRVWPAAPYQPTLKFLGIFSSENNFAEGPCQDTRGVGFEKLKYPISSCLMGGDKVLVVERTPPDIKVIDFSQKKVSPLFEQERPFLEPVDLAIDGNGNIYVADRKEQQVLVFSKKLKSVRKIGATLELKSLEKILLSEEAGILYLTDSHLNEGFAFDLEGTLLFRFGAGLLKEPHGLAIHQNGNIYLADTGNAVIRIFNSKGEFQEDFPIGQQRFPSPLKKPWDLAFDSQGKLHIIDQGLDLFLTCKDDGEILFATGTSRLKDNHLLGFHGPADIQIDESGEIFIADRNNFRLSVWQLISNDNPSGFFKLFGQNFALSCQEYVTDKTVDKNAKRPSVFKVGDSQNLLLERVVKKEFEESRDAYKDMLCLGTVKCKDCMSFNNIYVDTEHIEYLFTQTPLNGGQVAPEEFYATKGFMAECKKCNKALDLTPLLKERKIRFCLEPRELCPDNP